MLAQAPCDGVSVLKCPPAQEKKLADLQKKMEVAGEFYAWAFGNWQACQYVKKHKDVMPRVEVEHFMHEELHNERLAKIASDAAVSTMKTKACLVDYASQARAAKSVWTDATQAWLKEETQAERTCPRTCVTTRPG